MFPNVKIITSSAALDCRLIVIFGRSVLGRQIVFYNTVIVLIVSQKHHTANPYLCSTLISTDSEIISLR
jgi:hypothetical protein